MFERHNRNFTAFKVYVNIYKGLAEDIEDRFFNNRQHLKTQRKAMKDAVVTWCESNPTLVGAGYTVRFDQHCGCSCPCSPGFRVMVNKLQVMNSGYTQLLHLQRGRDGPKTKWIELNGAESPVF